MTSGPDPDSLSVPLAEDAIATLRHDLVNPINLIVGYCELLLAEAVDRPWSTVLNPLHSLRRGGFGLLQIIDGALLGRSDGRLATLPRDLSESMLGPALLLAHEAEAMVESANRAGLLAELIDDLAKIRVAADQLVDQAGALESAASWDHDRRDVGPLGRD